MQKNKRRNAEYWSGQNSYHEGRKEEDCPHREGEELSEWLRGFHDAADGIEEPFRKEEIE